MTFEPWRDDSYLVRLEHLLEKNEDENFSKSVKVNLKAIFGDKLNFKHASETNLAGNQWIEDVDRLQFKSEGSHDIWLKTRLDKDDTEEDAFDVTLGAMEIRTFVLNDWRDTSTSASAMSQWSWLNFGLNF